MLLFRMPSLNNEEDACSNASSGSFAQVKYICSPPMELFDINTHMSFPDVSAYDNVRTLDKSGQITHMSDHNAITQT